jgi:hypothetical protein
MSGAREWAPLKREQDPSPEGSASSSADSLAVMHALAERFGCGCSVAVYVQAASRNKPFFEGSLVTSCCQHRVGVCAFVQAR